MDLKCRWLVGLVVIVFISGCGGDEEVSGIAGEGGADGAKPAAAATAPSGEDTYNNFCFSCHTPGLSGAPKLGDTEAWGPRIAKGKDLLLRSTIEGMQPAMPPRGMCFDCSDEELAAAIDYIVQRSR